MSQKNFDNENVNGSVREHKHHHHHHRHLEVKKTLFSEKFKKLGRKIRRKILREGGKRETSLVLAVIIIMAIAVPVVISVLDAINRFFTQ